MEENKITITLGKFLEIYDKEKNLTNLNNIIIDYILSNSELKDDSKNKLNISYNIRYSDFLDDIIKKYYPEKYNARVEELQNN